MKKRTVFYIIYFVVFIAFMLSSFSLFQFEVENHKSEKLHREIVDDVSFQYHEDQYPYINISLEETIQLNSDTVGWIEVPNTNISYPVLQTKDNSYYLSHSFDKSENSAGWIFMDYRNHSILDDQVILYGHNRLDGSMFGSLKTLLSSQEKHYLFYNTNNEKVTYEVFSMYIIPEDEFISMNQFSSDTEHMEFLETIQNKSVIPTDVVLSSHDKIITLYTCYGYGNERLILHAKMVQLIEES